MSLSTGFHRLVLCWHFSLLGELDSAQNKKPPAWGLLFTHVYDRLLAPKLLYPADKDEYNNNNKANDDTVVDVARVHL